MRRYKTSLRREHFDFLSCVGSGFYSKVYLVRKIDTGEVLAMKVMMKEKITDQGLVDKILDEQDIMAATQHPFIVTLRHAFQSPSSLYLVSDFANGGDLFYHRAKARGKKFSEERAKFYAAELYLALEHMHSQGILHRDLKLENVLLDGEGHALLTDFGLAKKMPEAEDLSTTTVVGTNRYMPPEMQGRKVARPTGTDGVLHSHTLREYDQTADWWSYGIMVFLMLYGQHPFVPATRRGHEFQITDEEFKRNVLRRRIQITRRKLRTVSNEAQAFVLGLLETEAHQRLGATEGDIRRHPWFADIDFEALMNREVTPPFVPSVTSETDTKYVDPEFLKMGVDDIVTRPDSWVGMGWEDYQSVRRFKDFSHNMEANSPEGEGESEEAETQAPAPARGSGPRTRGRGIRRVERKRKRIGLRRKRRILRNKGRNN